MNTRAIQLTILQMTGNAVTLLEDNKDSAQTLPQMILTAEECTLEARWEQTENIPDREQQLAMLIRAAANCIRAAASLVPAIDPVEFVRIQLELVKTAPAPKLEELVDVPIPPAFDFIEFHNLLHKN